MTAANFTIVPHFVIPEEPDFSTIITSSEGQKKQYQSLSDTPNLRYRLQFKNMSNTNFWTLYNHYYSCKGPYDSFSWTSIPSYFPSGMALPISNITYTWTDLVAGNKYWYGITDLGTDLYATVNGGSIWKSADYGVTWTDLVAGDKAWRGITGLGTDLYATVYGGSIWKSADYGVTWTDLVAGNKYWYGITGLGTDLYAIVYGGSTWKSADYGVTWTDLIAGNKSWYDITDLGADLYAIVYGGSIWKASIASIIGRWVKGSFKFSPNFKNWDAEIVFEKAV